MLQGTPTSLCPTLSPPHPTSSRGNEDLGNLVRCGGGFLLPRPHRGTPKAPPPCCAQPGCCGGARGCSGGASLASSAGLRSPPERRSGRQGGS